MKFVLVKHKSCLVVFELIDLKNLFNLIADPCYDYQNLSDANRKSSSVTPVSGPVFCENQLTGGWYRFVGAAGTKMPTSRAPAKRCGTDWSGWLDGTHPTVEDGNVNRNVCFNDLRILLHLQTSTATL